MEEESKEYNEYLISRCSKPANLSFKQILSVVNHVKWCAYNDE